MAAEHLHAYLYTLTNILKCTLLQY